MERSGGELLGFSSLSSDQLTAEQRNMESLLCHIEDFLLPSQKKSIPDINKNNILPKERLNTIIHETAVSEHIRTMLTMYRDHDHPDLISSYDNDDKPILGINKHFHAFHSNQDKSSSHKIYTDSYQTRVDDLINKTLEGRTRIHALSKLCYGDDSIETMKSNYDLINAYALGGHWSAVHEQIGTLLSKYLHLQSKQSYIMHLDHIVRVSKLAADRISCFHHVLRDHVLQHRGQLIMEFVDELTRSLKDHRIARSASNISSSSNDDSFLDAAIGSDDEDDDNHEYVEEKSFVNSIQEYLQSYPKSSNLALTCTSPSWGDIMDHLRYENDIMRKWIDDLESGILPHIRGVLHMAFHHSDRQHRGVSHPGQLAANILTFPSSAKILTSIAADNNLLRMLSSMKSDIAIIIRYDDASYVNHDHDDVKNKVKIVDIDETLSNIDDNKHMNMKTITYDIPISWEETLCGYHSSNMEYVNHTQCNQIFRGQLLTLLGICHLFYHENLSDAEESFRQAIKIYESLGLQDTMISCELYNAIAQLMISKYRIISKDIKSICESNALAWIQSEEGINQIREESVTFRRQKSSSSKDGKSSSIVVNKLHSLVNHDHNIHIKNQLMKQKTKEFMIHEENVNRKSMEAAYRYLIKAYDIMESYHGSHHIVIATSCIAIASVKNTIKDYPTAREWLSKALKILMKIDSSSSPPSYHNEHDADLNPHLPLRIIAYVQIQLAHVMFKSGHEQEGFVLLSNTSSYHMQKSYRELKKLNKTSIESQFISNPITRTSSCYEDVQLAMTITNRLIQLLSKQESKQWDIIELSESISKLVETAFGWDSSQAAEQKKYVGVRYALVTDWMKAINHLRRSLEVYEDLYGEDSKHCIHIEKLLQAAAERRIDMFIDSAEKKMKDSASNIHDKDAATNDARDKSPPAASAASGSQNEQADHVKLVLQSPESNFIKSFKKPMRK